MIMPTGPTSAIVHAKGIEDLMKLQKPCFYISGVSHHLFVGFRPVLVSKPLQVKPTSLTGTGNPSILCPP